MAPRLHRLLTFAQPVTFFSRLYISAILLAFSLLGWWALWTFRENPQHIVLTLLVPRFDAIAPLARTDYEISAALLLAGWTVAIGLLLLAAFRVPARVQGAARTIRRMRELEREIAELRTLPIRQREDDEALAIEAHLETRVKRVMTEQLSIVTGKRPTRENDDVSRQSTRPESGSAR